MTPVGTSSHRSGQDLIPDRRPAWDISPDWIFAIILILGLTVMLVAIGLTPAAGGDPAGGPRVAVGMTPTDGAISLRIRPCGAEKVETVSLKTVEPELTLWEAIAINPQERYVFVVGQAPTTFVETVTMLEELPRGALLEATIVTDEPHNVQFLFGDLLPGLWDYGGTYYPDDTIDDVIAAGSVCNRGPTPATSGRRTLMVVGFLIAAAAGAGLLARRLVSPGL
ncbi:MAG: hypothetical protein P1T08_01435 [Acidimicrobiia bacterium]|nr:hypothetical protein [Acidimicrobiia bacterium]